MQWISGSVPTWLGRGLDQLETYVIMLAPYVHGTPLRRIHETFKFSYRNVALAASLVMRRQCAHYMTMFFQS
jgi:hypothetical protein